MDLGRKTCSCGLNWSVQDCSWFVCYSIVIFFSNSRTVVVREVTPWSCGRNDVVWIWGCTFFPREWFHYGIVSTSELWTLRLWIVSRGIWQGCEVLRWVNCSWTVLFADPRALDLRLEIAGSISQPLHCRVRPWTSCSHTSSSALEVTTLWRYIGLNQLKLKKKQKKFLSAAD